MTAGAGWYPDPVDPSRWAWWDGVRWNLSPAGECRGIDSDDELAETKPWLPRMRPLRLPVVFLAIGATLLIVAANVIAGGGEPDDIDVVTAIVGLGSLAFLAIGIPLLAWASSHFFGSKRFTRDLGWRIHWWDVPLGIAGAIAMWALAIGVALVAKTIGLPEGSNTDAIKDQMEQNPRTAFVLTLFVLATAAILAPLSEELLFRGMLFRGLVDKVPMWAAVGIQAVIFGCAHVIPSLGAANIGLLMVLSSLGLCLGVLAWLTGRLWSGIIAHSLFNASNVILLYLSIKS